MWPGGASDQIARGRDDAIASFWTHLQREGELHTASHPQIPPGGRARSFACAARSEFI